MIAATDPQEFVPSGRQQVFRHPGPQEVAPTRGTTSDDFLLNWFEKVSITESEQNEWWIIRKSPNSEYTETDIQTEVDERKSYLHLDINKSVTSGISFDNLSWKTEEPNVSYKFGKRDDNLTKSTNKRLSNESDFKPESKSNYSRSLLKGRTDGREKRTIKSKLELGFVEEELYVKGNIVVWSKILTNNVDCFNNARTIVCSYCSQFPIRHAIWCTFHCERPNFDCGLDDIGHKFDKPHESRMPAVCIIDSQNIKVFTSNNEDFICSLQFQVKKVWNIKYGILLEKENCNEKDNAPKLFSLAHPLEEMCPVAIQHDGISLVNNYNMQIVFTSENPSIAVIYNIQTGQHSVYYIRKLRNDEWVDVPGKYPSRSASALSTSNKLKSRISLWDVSKCNIQVLPSPSNTNSRPTSIASFCSLQPSRSHSSMATISRCQSPAVSPLVSGNPWLLKAQPHTSIRNTEHSSFRTENTSMTNSAMYQIANPVLCLDYIWSEPSSNSQDMSAIGAATKVFLCDDMTGQSYLCYLVPSKSQLCIVRVDFSNENNFIFGILTSISAKDAVPVPLLHILAILEHSGNVVLYSGLTVVGKLHIGGVSTQHKPSPLVKKTVLPFSSPYPKRSSLLPDCRGTPVLIPNFSDHLLSPVLPSTSKGYRGNLNVVQVLPVNVGSLNVSLNGLRDSIENRVTLQYSDGSFYRVILPPLADAPLIEDTINALQQTLQRDVAMLLLSRWYATRNSPGPIDLDVTQEWGLFVHLLMELLGYQDDQQSGVTVDTNTPFAKRQKQSPSGTDTDWSSMCAAECHKSVSYNTRHAASLSKSLNIDDDDDDEDIVSHNINSNAVLFPSIRVIHYTLHLLYEELKLNRLRYKDLQLLAQFLSALANDLGLREYAIYYWKDFPEICKVYKCNSFGEKDLKNITSWPVMVDPPFYIMQHIYDMLRGLHVAPFPYIPNVNPRCKDVVQLYGLLIKGTKNPDAEIPVDTLIKTIQPVYAKCNNISTPKSKTITIENSVYERAVLLMTEMKMTTRILDTLPAAISMFLYDVLWMCRENPPADWSAATFNLLWRPDLAAQSQIIEKDRVESNTKKYGMYSNSYLQELSPTFKQVDMDQDDGMEDVENPLMKLRFPDEQRVAEARRLLQSSKPITIVLAQRPDVSDHEYIEEQEKHLFALCTRTMALPVGRGMFTLHTATPVVTEPLPIPPLCLTGKAPPMGTTVELTHIETPSNMNVWPLFHNGVANGLRITPDARNIDTNWITFNKSKISVETQAEHAGFLMALGLNGHLKNLAVLSTYNYLLKLQEMTSIGILLGLSAAFRGTSHSGLTKALSIHVEALLPPTSMELDIPQNLQVAALLGIGLVYEGTAHRHMTEVLLTEIGRPPGPEMENSVDRESYSLAAGLALGFVTLKKGGRLSGLADLDVPDLLHYYMVGGNKRAVLGSQKDKYKVASFQIREGPSVNLDVTSPGATLALGLMYLGTGNKAVADWMAPPETQYLLDFVRPDFLMLRILARALIMWDDIEPTEDWVESQVPQTIRPFCMTTPSPVFDVDYEAMNQVYCNIVAGACFSIGLKYAGTANQYAFKTLLHHCHHFTSLTAKSVSELAGKPTIETCLNVCLISASMVMAGTGNLDIMRLVRHLRRRVGVTGNAFVTYGSHLNIHMALGLLFLGGSRYTLSNSPSSVALLISAFYPKFPTHSNDNRYHLQAFRHLYVLAAEPRLVIPKDVSLGTMCYAYIKVVYLDGTATVIKGPGLIPDPNVLAKVKIHDERYWPVVFERGRNWEQLQKLLITNGYIEVKQRAGCLSYIEDKMGYRSQLARTLTQSRCVPWDPPSKAIMSFTSECTLRYFCDNYLNLDKEPSNQEETRLRLMITRFTYDCVIKDKLVALPIFAALVKTVRDLKECPSVIQLWQLKLLCAQILDHPVTHTLISSEIILALKLEVIGVLDEWEESISNLMKSYVKGQMLDSVSSKLSAYVTFYDIPYGSFSEERVLNAVSVLQNLNLKADSISKILNVL